MAKNLDVTNDQIKTHENFQRVTSQDGTYTFSDKIKIINDSKSTNGESTAFPIF